jgi:phosphoribosylglycinamide formyltransferase-1
MQCGRELKINFLLAPFSKRPERQVLLKHRPDQFVGPKIRDIASYYDLKVWEYEERELAVKQSDYLIIGGANILEPDLANCGKIINGHAGIIPMVRGLDAFKWAILNFKPIGNTLHFIDEHADAGSVIHQQITPLFANDTLEAFAERHYKIEINMLANFVDCLKHGSKLDYPLMEPKMRMPLSVEQEMMDAFPTYKEKYAFGGRGAD